MINIPSNRQPGRSVRLENWAVLLSFWLIFGLSTLANDIALRALNTDNVAISLPTTTRDMIWLVVGIWISAYVVGVIVGYVHHRMSGVRRVMASVAAGYVLGIGLHLIFLGVFPNTPPSVYTVLVDFFTAAALPSYHTFLLLSLLIGPAIAAVAAYTGMLFSQEYRLHLPRVFLEPRLVIFSTLTPFALFILGIGFFNLWNLEDAEIVQLQAQLNRETVPGIVLLYLDYMINPAINMAIAAVIGAFVGFSYRAPTRTISAWCAGLGFARYTLFLFIVVRMFAPNTHFSVFKDRLGNLRTPSLIYFVLLWAIPPLIAAAAAFAVHNLRDTQKEVAELPPSALPVEPTI